MDEEEDAGVGEVGIRLGVVVAARVKEDGDTLWFLEQAAVEEGVWFGGGRGDLDADCDIRRDDLRIKDASTVFYGLGGALKWWE